MCNEHVNSKWSAIAKGKCSRCRSGKMFMYPATDLKRYSKMFEHCPVCGLKFEIETGFYWGAMYISYSMSVAMCFIICIPMFLIFDPPVIAYIIAIIASLLLTLPLMFRYSRILMLHNISNVKYDPKYAPAEKKKAP